MKLTIDRSKWVRGNIGGESMLLNTENNMCCLGFLGEKCGILEDEMLEVGTPYGLAATNRHIYHNYNHKTYFDLLLNKESNGSRYSKMQTMDLMDINDSKSITKEERECKLTELFKEIGIEVEFL